MVLMVGNAPHQKATLSQSQDGFAAIVVSIILVLVLSLITVGFARLMRHEQSQVTNRQLSSQAYYAAESGINDAARALANGYTTHKTTCGPDTGSPYLSSNNVTTDAANSAVAQWSCLLIDPAPTSLAYDSIDTVTPTVFLVRGVADDETTPVPINSVTISWQDADSNVTNFKSGNAPTNGFPSGADWDVPNRTPGILRLMITPLVGSLDRTTLADNTFTAFLYPTTAAAGPIPFGYGAANRANQGQIINGSCSTATSAAKPRYCQVTISAPAAGLVLPVNDYAMVALRSIYHPTNVYITARNAATGRPAHLQGAQALVDSTGKSQNVLKRIQARIPYKGHYAYPGFDVTSINDVCKQLHVLPNSTTGCGL